MKIKNGSKFMPKTATIQKNTHLGGYVVTIENHSASNFSGLLAPSYRLGIFGSLENAVKAVRNSCASFKGRGRIAAKAEGRHV
jgi:hypothetical protein